MPRRTKVFYFGYGANRDAEMINALIGRKPKGKPAKLFAHKLYVQAWTDIPNEVRDELSPHWTDTFKSYIVCPTENSSDFVVGKLWEISRSERKILDAWEVSGKWYDIDVLQYEDNDGVNVQIEVPMIKNAGNSKQVSGKYYKNFINSKDKMLLVAKKLRSKYTANENRL